MTKRIPKKQLKVKMCQGDMTTFIASHDGGKHWCKLGTLASGIAPDVALLIRRMGVFLESAE